MGDFGTAQAGSAHGARRRVRRLGGLVAVAVAIVVGSSGVEAATAPTLDSQQARTGTVTYLNGPARNGVYSSMHRLTPSAVAGNSFHRLFDQPLPDGGQVYAQPLLVAGRLVVATERNDVYELDPRSGRILASRSLGPAWQPTFANGFTCHDLYPTIGITSTPVVDTVAGSAQGIIYLTAKVSQSPAEARGFNPAQYRMYALRLSDLANASGFNGGQPLVLGRPAPGTPARLAFQATNELQRPALLQVGNVILAGFGSHCSVTPYRGYVMAVTASDGRQVGTWESPTAPGASGASVWMAGAGLMSDGSNRVFFATGNASDSSGSHARLTPGLRTPATHVPSGLGVSVVRLNIGPSGSLRATNFFTPCNGLLLDDGDLDMASGGVLALPSSFGNSRHRELLSAGGKGGRLFLLDRNSLGGFTNGRPTAGCPHGSDAIPDSIRTTGGIWGASAAWGHDGNWLIFGTGSEGPSAVQIAGRLNFVTGHAGALHLAASTGLIWRKGSSSVIITSVGGDGRTALAWGVSRSFGGDGTLVAYRVVVPRGQRQPVRVRGVSVGPFAKFTPPGVGPDEIFVGGDGHVEGFGF